MNLSKHPLRTRFLASALTIVLAVGMMPLPALANPSITAATMSELTEAIDVTNASKTVGGDVKVSNNTFAVKARGEGANGVGAVDVSGSVDNVTADEGKSTYGVITYGFDGGKGSVNVGGSVNAIPTGSLEKPSGVGGIFTKASAGDTTIDITGNVNTIGTGDAKGIRAESENDASISMKVRGDISATSSSSNNMAYDAFSVDTQAMDGAKASLEVGGNVTAKAQGSDKACGCGVIMSSGANEGKSVGENTAIVHGDIAATGTTLSTGAKVSSFAGAHSQLVVDGNVTGKGLTEGAGAWVESIGGATTTLVVQGTVRGSATGLLFDGNGKTNFDIAVWKIEVDEGGTLLQKGSYASGVPDDLSSQVNYIVKVEQPSEGGTLRAVGPNKTALAKRHGFDVAHAGDKVYLDASLEAGYYLKGAYNGKDERVPLACDKDGFYVTVPEGGGVYLTAELGQNKGMNIVNGMAQPVYKYSDVNAKDYSNKNSELYRFVVYVETDYDTDRDGKCDLVKAFVQVPRAAVEGTYEAPVLFRADPYAAGMQTSGNQFGVVRNSPGDAETRVDDALLSKKPEQGHRQPTSTISSKDLALSDTLTKRSDWNYEVIDGIEAPDGITTLDYYLVRGFAIVQASGLGTYGSEGIECCGTVMERDAFVNIVEWLHGKEGRKAFADAAGTIEVLDPNGAGKPGWSSGHVGMTGLSYPGAMCYEVATSGVEGLDTIVPVAGPSSWYDFSNKQGICTSSNTSYNYTTVLADTCATRLFTNESAGIAPDPKLLELYQQYRAFMSDAQGQLQGDYGPYWANRDWYTGQTGIHASALIVTGMNDGNVSTKHFDLMRTAFLKSGCEVKSLLHQNAHITPANEQDNSDIMIGDHTYFEWLNLWFTRALVGVDNQASTLPDFTIQSNVDGTFYASNTWNSDNTASLRPSESGQTVVSAKGAPFSSENVNEKPFTGKTNENAAVWTLPANEQMTIAGKIPVHVRAKVDNVGEGDIMMSAVLLDVADEPFRAFAVNGSIGTEVIQKGDGTSLNYDLVRWMQGTTTKKVVTTGRIDLRNPEAGYEPSTATKRETPIEADTYYDYTIWLNPVAYTVQPGHRLELYILSALDYINYPSDVKNSFLERQGLNTVAVMKVRDDYSFTIDNAASYAELPLGSGWEPTAITNATTSPIAAKTYTGKALTPKPDVSYNGQKLKENVDYTLSYKNNVKAGTAKVFIAGKGAYTGTKVVTFKIKKAAIKSAKATKVKPQKYTGKAIKPNPTFTYKGKTLKKGRDYTLTYNNNKKPGTAKIIAKGKGNFKGKKVVTFKIVK